MWDLFFNASNDTIKLHDIDHNKVKVSRYVSITSVIDCQVSTCFTPLYGISYFRIQASLRQVITDPDHHKVKLRYPIMCYTTVPSPKFQYLHALRTAIRFRVTGHFFSGKRTEWSNILNRRRSKISTWPHICVTLGVPKSHIALHLLYE